LLIGLVVFTRALHVEHFALAIIDDLIGRFDLIQERLYLSERLTARCILRIGLNEAPRI
jgi:hypothetical protein